MNKSTTVKGRYRKQDFWIKRPYFNSDQGYYLVLYKSKKIQRFEFNYKLDRPFKGLMWLCNQIDQELAKCLPELNET